MKRIARHFLIFHTFVVGTAAGALSAPASENRMHPQFQLLDAEDRPVATSKAPISDARTCGACHDAQFINGHSLHYSSEAKVSCTACHYQGGKIEWTAESFEPDARLKRSWVRIAEPTSASCAACHGLAHLDQSPLRLPDDFIGTTARTASGQAADRAAGNRPAGEGQSYDLSHRTGAVFSPQNLSDSYLNLAGKAELSYPWDIHARRLVECTHCHFAANNPERTKTKAGTPAFLKNDPRKLSLNEYLYRPDHRLVSALCTDCHEPTRSHDFLPYTARHLQALSCQSCHIPHLMGPALQSVDATVVNEKGEARIEYRGADGPGEANTTYRRGYSPFLLPVRAGGEKTRLSPFNLVSRWQWVSGHGREAVAAAVVRDAYLADDRYRPEIFKAFDANLDGRIDDAELILDSPAKIELIRAKLEASGVRQPEIAARVDAYPVDHGVMAGELIKFQCSNCHATNSRLDAAIPLASRFPGGAIPNLALDSRIAGVGTVERDAEGRLSLNRPEGPSQFYVFGHSSAGRVDAAGLVFFAVVALLVAVHAAYRMLIRRSAKAETSRERAYLFSAYERVWHWTMAVSVIVLLLTGFRIHYLGNAGWPGLQTSVLAHNFFAVVLTLNAFLALFYHVAGSAIRQFLPAADNLAEQVRTHTRYYLSGMFRGHPHPHVKTPERKLNPLQQITYLLLLNLLFPWQILTGVLIWANSQWPDVPARLGGLPFLAPLHQLGAWLFLSFFVLHVYLTTTGRTVSSNVKTMINGYDEIEVPSGALGEKS